MKKVFLKVMTAVLMIAMVFTLVACGGDKPMEEAPQKTVENTDDSILTETAEKEEKVENDIVNDIMGTKTMAYFHKYLLDGAYTMESKYEIDGMEVLSFSAVDGNNMYSKTETNGMESIMLLTDDAQYILDPASKMAIKMSVGTDGGLNMQEMFAEEEENYEVAVAAEEIEIGGKKYFCEEFEVDGSVVKYCFDGNEMKYIITEMDGIEYVMEILSMKKGADVKLFELPDGYQIMTF